MLTALLFFLFVVHSQNAPQKLQQQSFTKAYQSLKTIIALHDTAEDESDFKYWYSAQLIRDTNFSEVKTALTNFQALPIQKKVVDFALWAQDHSLAGDIPHASCSSGSSNSGRINAISFTNATTMFLGTCGGLKKRNNTTGTITDITSIDNNFSSGIAVISPSPSNTNQVYLASGYGVNNNIWGYFFSSCSGINVSSNGGNTFSKSGLWYGMESNMTLTDIAVSHTNSNRVFAVCHCYPNGGSLMHSEDGGVTWTDDSWKLSSTDHFLWCVKYTLDGKELIASGHHIYKSYDDGATWQKCDNMLQGLFIDTASTNAMIVIAVPPSGSPSYYNKMVLAFCQNGSGNGTTVENTDSWISFDGFNTSLSKKDGISSGTDLIGCWGLHPPVVAIGVQPPSGFIIYLGGVFCYTWPNAIGKATILGIHADVRSLASPPYNGKNQNELWIATDGGLYHSTDGGKTAAATNAGLNCSLLYSVDKSIDGSEALGTQDDAEKIYQNGSWQNYYFGDCGNVLFNKENSGITYGHNFEGDGYVYEGHENDCTTPIYFGDTLFHFSPIPMIISPDNTTVYYGMHNLWQYTDADSIKQITNFKQQFGIECGAITAISKINQTIIAATQGVWMINGKASTDYNNPQGYEGYNLFISYDNGTTWNDISPQIIAVKGSITSILQYGVNVYITYGGYNDLNGKNENVFFADNPSKPKGNWQAESSGLPKMPSTKIVADAQGNLYVATDAGIFVTNEANFNAQWKSFNLGLPLTIVKDIEVDNTGGVIYAATYGRGLYSSPLYKSSGIVTRSDNEIFPLHNCKSVIEENFYDYENGQYLHTSGVADYYPIKDSAINGISYTEFFNNSFIRIDGKKVRAILPDLGIDTVYIDFGLNIGDTLFHVFAGVDTFNGVKRWVAGIDSVMLSDGPHRRLHIVSNNFYVPETYWIEGIGDARGIWNWRDLLYYNENGEGQFDYTMTCFFENGDKIYSQASPSGKYDCDEIINGIQTVTQSGFRVYPTLSSGEINFEVAKPSIVSVFAADGKLVERINVDRQQRQTFPSGLYIALANNQSIKFLIK